MLMISRACNLTKPSYICKKCRNIHNNHRLLDFPQTYSWKDAKRGRYEAWEINESIPPKKTNNEPFKMILPPPNVTGTLHLGHALTATVQDVLARWHRMNGTPVVWIPGFDHAGIATQAVVEKHLWKIKKLRRSDITKEELISSINEWKNENSSNIKKQLKDLGLILDWSKEYFTMSSHHNRAVTEAIVTLDERGLLFRDKDMINWSPTLGSAISDVEVDNLSLSKKTDIELPGYNKKVSFGQIMEISYNLKDSDETLTVATTRPETIPGDVAIAVNPNDDRYTKYIGQFVKHPLKETFIPVIADASVKMNFGTGIVKITPAHDRFDLAIAKTHNLPLIEIIDENGNMTEAAGKYKGLPRFTARTLILNELSNRGALKSVKDHEMTIPICSRTGDLVEALVREQWFINCKSMAERSLKAVEDGLLKLDPSFHTDLWFEWLGNIRNWCISRQLVWGHRIPAYYCSIDGVKKWIVARSEDEAVRIAAEKFGDVEITQDNDVLDTWFSAALLPFSSLGWPNQTEDLKKYYPLSLMETGHDILFFWVARMVMLGLELQGTLPFKEVLLHGILCDSRKKKMSKSRGNVIYPENIIDGISLKELNKQAKERYEKGILSSSDLKTTLSTNVKMFPIGIPECGVDALRLTLCSHNIKNRQVSFDIVECQENKFFCNKIWQASRYTILFTSDDPIKMPESYSTLDRWILSKLSVMVSEVNEGLEHKNFYRAVAAIREFLYYEFCDYYVEGTKMGFKSENEDLITSHRYTLSKCLEVSLRILAPFAPYLCDDLYSKLSEKLSIFTFEKSLLESSYPLSKEFSSYRNIEVENKMDDVIKVISSIRTMFGTMNKKFVKEVQIVTDTGDLYNENIKMISWLCKCETIKIVNTNNYTKPENSISANVLDNTSIHLVSDNVTVFEEAKKRIEKKRSQTERALKLLLKNTKQNCDIETQEFKISRLKETLRKMAV